MNIVRCVESELKFLQQLLFNACFPCLLTDRRIGSGRLKSVDDTAYDLAAGGY